MGAKTPVTAVEVVNIAPQVMKFNIDGVDYELKPKETMKISPSYALPRQMQKDKDPVPSVIELMTGGNVLATSLPKARRALGLPAIREEG